MIIVEIRESVGKKVISNLYDKLTNIGSKTPEKMVVKVLKPNIQEEYRYIFNGIKIYDFLESELRYGDSGCRTITIQFTYDNYEIR